MEQEKITAIVLAAGQGRRMESHIQKQFMLLDGKPLIYYALRAFEESQVDEVILVTGCDEIVFCQKEIIDKYSLQKVVRIVAGGKERYHSVYEGLKAVSGGGYVLIHDGARPLVNEEIINTAIEGAVKYAACVVAMPVKDTIKFADHQEFSCETPDRSRLWQIQTPQAFSYDLIFSSYKKMLENEKYQKGITDDAMVIETVAGKKVKLVRGSYSNIKVTTPEDIMVAEAFLRGLKSPDLSIKNEP